MKNVTIVFDGKAHKILHKDKGFSVTIIMEQTDSEATYMEDYEV